MADWDTNNPDDNDIVSQYPSNERAARSAVVTNFGVDHHEVDDADVGKHEVIQLVDQGAAPTIVAGQVGVWNEGGETKIRVGAGTPANLATEEYVDSQVGGVQLFDAGTKMVFYQATAPTGWTQDTTVNDRVLRVVSTAGGGTGGSWTISGISVNNHTLTTSQIPAHSHGSGSLSTGSAGSHSHSGSTGGAGAHNHGITRTSSQGSTTSNGTKGTTTGVSNTTTDSVGNHTHSLSINSGGAHTHSISGSTSNTGSGSGHNHGLTIGSGWRPSHIDVMVAIKD